MAKMRGVGCWAEYREETAFRAHQSPNRVRLAVPAYRQEDGHSCGFLAALTVVRYFHPEVDVRQVMDTIRPHHQGGCDQRRMFAVLKRFGVQAREQRMGCHGLFLQLCLGRPVIVTVWPESYGCDHWCVVRGLDRERLRVHLVNYGSRRGMDWSRFYREWWPRGLGLVCRRI